MRRILGVSSVIAALGLALALWPARGAARPALSPRPAVPHVQRASVTIPAAALGRFSQAVQREQQLTQLLRRLHRPLGNAPLGNAPLAPSIRGYTCYVAAGSPCHRRSYAEPISAP